MQRILIAGLFMLGILACSDKNDGAVPETVRAANAAVMLPAGTTSMLAAGTTFQATIQDNISSTTSATGQRVKAVVSLNVVDAAGHIVIPGGSSVVLRIAQLRPAKRTGDGVITLAVESVTIGDSTYAPVASVGAVTHTMRAGAAAESDREVVATPGTPITIQLTHPLKISAI
jgi:hypothetical protein